MTWLYCMVLTYAMCVVIFPVVLHLLEEQNAYMKWKNEED